MATESNGLTQIKETLWKAADKLRNNLDAAEYKQADQLQRAIRENPRSLGYEI